MTNDQLVAAYRAVDALSDQPMGVRAALQIKRLRRALEPAEDVLELRQEKLEEYAERNGDGEMQQVEGGVALEDPQGFNEEIEALAAMEADVNGDLPQIEVGALETEDVEVTAAQLEALDEAGVLAD